jgi:hypothetical protein
VISIIIAVNLRILRLVPSVMTLTLVGFLRSFYCNTGLPRRTPWSVHVRCVMDKAGQGQVFLRVVLLFPLSVSFHRGSPYPYTIMNKRHVSDRSSETQPHLIDMNNTCNNRLYNIASWGLVLHHVGVWQNMAGSLSRGVSKQRRTAAKTKDSLLSKARHGSFRNVY